MTAAIIALSAVVVVLAGVLAGLSWTIQQERHEWVTERRALVDRVIAQHTGEVIALDRAQSPRKERQPEPVPIEGLN